VLDALGLALGELVLAVALDAEACQVAGVGSGHPALKTLRILLDDDFVAADQQGALAQADVAVEDVHLVDVVDRDPVGLEVHRFLAVGLFGAAERDGGGEQRCAEQQAGQGSGGLHGGQRRFFSMVLLTWLNSW
jgi:hypothetical protein